MRRANQSTWFARRFAFRVGLLGGHGEDPGGAGLLDEGYGAERRGWRGNVEGRAGGNAAEVLPLTNYGVVQEFAAAIFASGDGGFEIVLDEGDDEVRGFGFGEILKVDAEVGSGAFDGQRTFGLRSGFGHGLGEGCAVRTDELPLAVYDHLGRVWVGPEPVRVGGLPLGEGCGREGIGPAEAVPVVDVEAERNHFHTLELGLAAKLAQQIIGRGATGAAF